MFSTIPFPTHRVCMGAKLLQLCLTLCDPMDYTPPGSSVHGIFQAKILEWVAMSFSRGFSRPVSLASPALAAGFITAPPGKPQPGILLLLLSHFSRVRLCVTP